MLNIEKDMLADNYKVDHKKVAKNIEETYLPISALVGKLSKSQSGGGKSHKIVHKINDDILKKIGYRGITEDIIGKETQISSKIINGIAKKEAMRKDMVGGKFGFSDLFGNEVPPTGGETLAKTIMGSPIQHNLERSLPYNNESIMPNGSYHQPDYSPSKFGGGKRSLKEKYLHSII